MKKEKKIEEIIKKIEELPILKDIIIKVLKVFDNPYSNAEDLKTIISMDQSLTLKVLKLANSAYYGFPRQIDSVSEAVVILGFLTVRNIILTSTIYNMFIEKSKDDHIFNRKEFWKHCVATGISAKIIAERLNLNHEEYFTIGLLHDVGKIFFDIYFNEQFIKLLKENKNKSILFSELEKKEFGFSHGEVGALIVDKWNLPEIFIEPIKYHHYPISAKNKQMASIIHIADIISKVSSINYDNSDIKSLINEESLKILKLQTSDLIEIIKNLEKELAYADLFFNY